MDYTCRTKTLQSLAKAMEKETICLSHKLQRPEGQWNRKQKSDLIDSLLRKYPINPSYGIKEDNIISIIDGVQRLSTVRDFLNNKFSLSKDMEDIEINGVIKNIAGLKFKKLDDEIKDILYNSELQIYELSDCTEKDVKEMFRRQNAGKSLSKKQLRIVHESDSFSNDIYELSIHPFMDKIMTNAQRKNGTDRDVIIQTLMLIKTNKDKNFTSFRSKDVDSFVKEYEDTNKKDIDLLKTALDKFNNSFETIKIPVTSIPMILYCGYVVTKSKKSFAKLVAIINDFIINYDSNQEYKKFVISGTSNQDNVIGRFEYWKELAKI